MLLACICVSFAIFGVFVACGIITLDNGISFNLVAFRSIKGHWWSWLAFILLQAVVCSVLLFVPGVTMAFNILEIAIFGAGWESFLICVSGIVLQSLVLYFVGRFGGSRLIIKLFGEEDYLKAERFIKDKGQVYYPLIMLLPFWNDDLFVAIAGVIKMNFLFWIISTFACRIIGCATLTFGISLVPFETFTTLWDWIVFLTVVVFWVIIMFYIATKINKYLEKHKKK